MRRRIFEIIDKSDTTDIWGNIYDYVMILVIAASLVPLAYKKSTPAFTMIDSIAVLIFIVDYLLRLLTADIKYNKKSVFSFLRYPVSIWGIIDLASILPSLIMIHPGFKLVRLFRMLRAFRVFRVFKALRYSKSIEIVISVFKRERSPLTAVGTLTLGYILVSALVVFNVEPDLFDTFFTAVYWAAITLTTIGYGDIHPITFVGRMVTVISAIIGIAVVALPAGIITAGYMNILGSERSDEDEET